VFALLVAAGILGVGAIVVGLALRVGEGKPKVEAAEQDDAQSFENLMESGKDRMQSEEWTEAAKLFAIAQQKNPGGVEARELKALAVKEADAQNAFTSGLTAQENRNWKEAVDSFSKIPRSSHYYDGDLLREVSSKLCDELLEKASFVEKTGTRADLDDVIGEIFQIPFAPERCRGDKSKILAAIEKQAAAEKDGGVLEGLDPASLNHMHRRELQRQKVPPQAPTLKRSKRTPADGKPEQNKPRFRNPYADDE